MTYKYNPFTHKLDLVGSGTGGGDVNGPGSSTDNAVVRWDGVSGTLIQNSVAILSDAGDLSVNSIDLTIALAATDGGTGQTSYTTGDLLYASSASALSKLPIGTNSQVLTLSGGLPSWQTPAASGVTSVSGTTDRITSTGGTTPVIDIAATYVGQTSITTLGTIATGTWNATAIGVTKGGTGLTSASQGDLLYGSAANTYSALAKDTNSTRYLSNTGSSNNPAWAQVALSTGVSGQLPLANGGTNANLTASNGGIFYSSSSAGAILAGTATANQVLLSGASTTPAWSTATYPATVATGDMLYASATNILSKLTTVNNSVLTTNSSGVPTWPTPPTIIPGILGWFNGAPAIQTTERYAYIYDDFLGGLSMTGVTANGGSTSYVTFPSALGGNNAGYYQVRSGTSTNGFASALLGGVNEFAIQLPTGLMYWETVLRGDQIGSVGDQLNLYFGVHNGASGSLNDGIYFSYVYATDTTHWIINTKNSGTATSTVTSVVADPSTFTKLAFLYNSTGPTCTFYINGSSVGTITTNFPTASIGSNWIIQKVSGTTNVGWFIDLVNWVIQFTNSR